MAPACIKAVPGPGHRVGDDAMPWPVLGEGHCCCPATASVQQKGARLCQMCQNTVGTTSRVDKWCRELAMERGSGTWGLSWSPVGKPELSWDKAPVQSIQFGCPWNILPQAHFWDTNPLCSAEVRPTAPRLQGTTGDLLQAAGTETRPAAPFLPRHLHDRDVEGVGDVGGSGQVPAAVETFRVVVGPAHQHWLPRGGCRGKRKEQLFFEMGLSPGPEQGDVPPLSAAASSGGDTVYKGSLVCVYQLLEASGGLCPMSAAEVLHETLLWTGLCTAAHLLPWQFTSSNKRWSGREGWKVPGEIVFKAVTEMLLMGRRCCSLDPIKLQRSWLSLPCPWGVINLLRDDPPKDQRSSKGGRRTAYGKMRRNNLKPAEKIQLCRRTGYVNAFSSGAEHPTPGSCLPGDTVATGDRTRACSREQPFSGLISHF